MSQLATICRCCISEGIPRRSFFVAMIVGAILNLINQGDALFSHGNIDFTKIILTFAVPYCVGTYGAVSYRMSGARSSSESNAGDDRAASPVQVARESTAQKSMAQKRSWTEPLLSHGVSLWSARQHFSQVHVGDLEPLLVFSTWRASPLSRC